MKPADLPTEISSEYTALRELPDGRLIGVHRLLYHWTLHVDIDFVGYADRYCFATFEGALKAFLDWDGTGDPEGWHRHRRNLATGEEWVQW